jgi:hypothetical protein
MNQKRIILFYYNRAQTHHTRLINALHDSYPGLKALFETNSFTRNSRLNQRADYIVFAGMIRGDGNIYNWCRNHNKAFFFLDHAYLNRGYNTANPENEWFRITDSEFLWNKIEHRTQERWNQYFSASYPLLPHRTQGKHILVLPPSKATQFIFPNSKSWLDQSLKSIQQYSDKPIVVREKPTQHVLGINNQIIRPLRFDHEKTIEKELEDAYAVVTYNSGVTVEAAIMGIPVICDQNNAAAPISNRIEQLANLSFHARESWLYQLVHHQYRTKEIMDGTVWQWLLPNGKI